MSTAQTAPLDLTEAAAGLEPDVHELAGFLSRQVEALGELDFVVLVPQRAPVDAVEISLLENGDYVVRLPSRPPSKSLNPFTRDELAHHGYRLADGPVEIDVPVAERAFPRSPEAAAAAVTVLRDILGHPEGEPLDIRHGSRRPERDAARKLVELRARIEPVLAEFTGSPPELDGDGDYLVAHHGLTVMVAPRSVPGGVPMVRVAAITNLGVASTQEVGTLLANLNFGIAFGRFAFDAEHRAIWFDETLLGDDLQASSLKLTIEVIAHTAAEWADKFRQLFGGITQGQAGEIESDDDEPDGPTKRRKPGQGGYL